MDKFIETLRNIGLYYLIIINIIAFITYGIDKFKAQHNRWRIPESTLILLAALGGSVGAFLAMQLFRHKTKHPKFYICVPIFIIIHAAIIAYVVIH